MPKEVIETKLEKTSARDEAKISDTIVLREGNISLILDSYDDIFSDFDPRPYDAKALSDDFLVECRRATKDKESNVELRLLVPKHKRNIGDEIKIKKRLKSHFQRHFMLQSKEQGEIKKEGIIWFIIGTCFILATSFLHQKSYHYFILTILATMMEPAGWFSFWEGLYKVFITAKEKKSDYDFYKKMNSAKIYFLEY